MMLKHHHRWPAVLVFAMTSLSATTSFADATLEILAQKGIINAEDYLKIQAAQREQTTILHKDGTFKIIHPQASLQLTGMIQIDAAAIQRSDQDAASGTEARRVRLGLTGSQGAWEYRIETELAGTATFTDAYAAWSAANLKISIGNMKTLYSLESLSADRNLSFMERSLAAGLLPARAPSITIATSGTQWQIATGLVGEPLQTSTTDDEGGGLSIRGSYAPQLLASNALHLGTSLHVRIPTQQAAGKPATVRLSSKPEINQFTDRLVDTVAQTGAVDRQYLASVELGKAIGSVLLQAEYTWVGLDRKNPSPTQTDNVNFAGGYAQAAWLITGESRPYQVQQGVFGGVRPNNAVAWEVAARYSQLDLNDADIRGGQQNNASAALNAYIGTSAKASLNYVKVLKLKGGAFDQHSADAWMLRGQYAF